MGADKAWVEISGRPLIERVLSAARPVAASLSIIISADNPNIERYRTLAAASGARLLFDLHDHRGPLGGIHTALANCGAGDAALNLACDLPFLSAEFLALLCQKHRSGPANVTVPLDAEGRLQPLAAIYDQACLAAVEAQLAASRLRVDQLFDVVPIQRLVVSDFAHLPGAAHFFVNLNSPEDLSFVVKP
jgi:molybdopterin-guanine dinucleotide biosynthesis protein A